MLIEAIHNEYGHSVPFYDNGSGDIYVLRDSTGIVGCVRADTWEAAYEIAEDEIYPEAVDDIDTMLDIFECDNIETMCADAAWQEAYGFRPNGPNMSDRINHGIYEKDLNGEILDILRPEFGLIVSWNDED